MEISASKLYEQANKARYDLGDVDTAMKLYKEIISTYPTCPQAEYAQNQIKMIEGFTQAQEDTPEQSEAEHRSKVVVTTAPSIDGFRVRETLEVVTAECVFGMNLFKDLFAGVRDIFGGRSTATQKVLREARITCLEELKREAEYLGANAVIATRLDYSEFSGGGKSMLFLVASGTAVVIKNVQAKELDSTYEQN